MPAPTILFDLDGTLVDTAPDLVRTLNVIFAREGMPPLAYEEARPMIGGGARLMLERGLLKEGRALPPAEIDRLVGDFISYYTDHIADHSQVFPGVQAALELLAARGARLAVCTNKREHLAVLLLQRLGLDGHFAAISGADTFGIGKPDPAMLRQTLARVGGRPDAAVMVGDSIIDVAAAKAASMPVILVDFGYTEIPARDTGADRVIGDYRDLADAIAVFGLTPARL